MFEIHYAAGAHHHQIIVTCFGFAQDLIRWNPAIDQGIHRGSDR